MRRAASPMISILLSVASRRFSSAAYFAKVSPWSEETTPCAAFSMSHRWTLSRSGSIYDLLIRQDRPPPVGIAQGLLFDQVDLTAEDGFQLGPHPGEVPESPGRARFEGEEDVHIAVRPEIGSQDGAEEGEFRDSPTPAKVADAVAVDGEVRGHRSDCIPAPGGGW